MNFVPVFKLLSEAWGTAYNATVSLVRQLLHKDPWAKYTIKYNNTQPFVLTTIFLGYCASNIRYLKTKHII